MSTPLQRAYRFCLGDGSLTIAVFIPIYFVFVLNPMTEVGVIRRVWLDIVLAAFLAMGAIGSYLLIDIVFTQAYRLLAANLFLAVLVARLVGREIDWRHEQRDLRRAEAGARAAEPDKRNTA